MGEIYRSTESNVIKDAAGGKAINKRYGPHRALVFISHRQTDAAAAGAVAKVLIEVADVDVYLEAFDPKLSTSGNPNTVVSVIDFGLNACTHLVAVVSDNTRGSWWVPYEIGVARNRPVPCAVLPLSNVKDLPEYMRTVDVVKDTYELVGWTKKLPNRYIYKSVNPAEFAIPGLPSFRTDQIIYRD